MKLYNENFLKNIDLNLEDIEKKGNIAKAKYLEPNIEEYNDVIKIIIKYIEDNNRIVYGGKCWEALLKKK